MTVVRKVPWEKMIGLEFVQSENDQLSTIADVGASVIEWSDELMNLVLFEVDGCVVQAVDAIPDGTIDGLVLA